MGFHPLELAVLAVVVLAIFGPKTLSSFMHGAGKFGITSLMNLELLPTTGALVIAAPLKIVNGSGSPLRVIAITP